MSLTTSEMTPADIRACTCGNDGYGNGGGMWGDGAAEMLMEKAEEMLQMTQDPKERRAIEKFMHELDD